MAHIGEELRLVLASRFNVLIKAPQFLAHPIDVGRQRTQLVAIDDMNAFREIAARNLVEPGFYLLDGTDQRPRDRIAEDQGEHIVGLQPRPPVRDRDQLRRAGRVQAVHPRRPRARDRGHRRRRLQPRRAVRSRPVAVRRLGRGRRRRDLRLQRRAGDDAVGGDPPRLRPRRGPHVPARQRDDVARGVPLRRAALRLDREHPVGDG